MLSMLSSLDPVARITVATLFNSLWEAALLALVVWAILRIVPNTSATTRYAAWSCALVASLLLPLATAIPQISVQHSAHVSAQTAQTRTSGTEPARTAKTVSQPRTALQAKSVPAKSVPATGVPASGLRMPERLRFALPEYVALGLFAAWALAALALLARLGVNLYKLERLKTDALPLPVDYRERLSQWGAADKGGREVRLCICDRIEVPVAVGLFDSMILIPQHLLDTLSQDEIDQIMLHELAHLRRADDWTNGVQRLIQALFFFNPAVLFIAQQLDLEREVACDDWVVRQTESVRPYASCLTKMAEVTAWPHRALAAPGVFLTRRGLSVRVERLLRAGRDIRTSISFGPAGAVVAALVVLFFVLQSVAPTFAFTLQEDLTIPAMHVHVAAQAMHLPPSDVRVPEQHVHVAQRTVWIPPVNVNVPAQHIHIPKVVVPNPHVAVPSDLVANAVNLGLAGASLGLKAAALHMKAAHLSQSDLQNFNCTGCDYSNQNLSGHNFRNQRFNGTDFSRSNLENADFSGSVLVGVDFSGANLRGANFRNAKMNGCDLSRADVTGANFDGADVVGCDVQARSLSPEQARMWLRTCRSGCDFAGADLRGQDLSGIDLEGVDLSGANLSGANLSNAKLTGIDFSNAHLDGANVNGTEFVGCDFDGVNMNALDMSKARFVGDKFSRGGQTPP